MNTPTILQKIVTQKKLRIAEAKQRVPLQQIIERAGETQRCAGFYAAMKKEGLSIIGEIKKASPSKGLIREHFDPIAIADAYADSVDGISVLTEEDFFLGGPDILKRVAAHSKLPLLRKDFIIDEYQLYEAKCLGASCVLLIAAILDEVRLCEFLRTAKQMGMDCLVEAHDQSEAERAVSAGARLLGINNRNLHSFEVDLNTTVRIAKRFEKDVLIISESGIDTALDIQKLAGVRLDAILVGESFMRCSDIHAKAEELRNAYAKG